MKTINGNVDVIIDYCALGLPSYATLTFENNDQLNQAKQLIENEFTYEGDRKVVVKTSQNN